MTPDAIAEGIAAAIRSGDYAEGDQLVQEELAGRFGVSRNPVREALRLLEAQGLVLIRDGGGATVRVLSADDLAEVYAMRVALEPTITAAVIDGATSRAASRLDALADRMEAESDADVWLQLNFEFHTALHELAERPRTAAILRSLLTAALPYARRNVREAGGREQADLDHRAIIEALRAGDSDALADLLVSHMTRAEDRIESTLRG